MDIGKVSYSDKLKSLSWSKFKKWWGKHGKDLSAEEAAKKFGIKTPQKEG